MSNLGTPNIAGPPQPDFICVLCGEAKKYDSWEQMEVTFANPTERVHLGCLREYAKDLTTAAFKALEQTGMGFFEEARKTLKEALHVQ